MSFDTDYGALISEQQYRIAAAQHRRDNPVIEVFEALGSYVRDFETQLDDNHELGARLVSFGSSIQIHVQSISYSKPFLITFEGIDGEGRRMRLIQHVSQLSFLLVAVPKLKETPYRIGFIWEKDSQNNEQA